MSMNMSSNLSSIRNTRLVAHHTCYGAVDRSAAIKLIYNNCTKLNIKNNQHNVINLIPNYRDGILGTYINYHYHIYNYTDWYCEHNTLKSIIQA